MKKINLIALLILIVSCSTDNELEFNQNSVKKDALKNINNTLKDASPLNIPIYSTNELIVQYENNVTEAQKESIRNQVEDIISYEECNCTDKSIEKWTFGDGIDIEVKKGAAMPEEGGVEGVVKNIDKEFSFDKEDVDIGTSPSSMTTDYQSAIAESNAGVTIAILDTGLDVDQIGFHEHYLFNASALETSLNTNLPNQISGWDYVNEDDDANDDYAGIHGTKVAIILHSKLLGYQVPHQILPIKVADNSGKISAFNLLCGMKNAVEVSDIINMSLGFYSNVGDDSTIMEDLILTNPNVLFVTSAGNNNQNNDEFKHFPSSYPQENVLAIAAAREDGQGKADFSNYGQESVDFYAKGENIPFENYEGSSVEYISGTSYATPYITAISAKLFYESDMTLSPEMITQNLNLLGNYISEDSDKVKYGKIIQ